jgi:excisionase family DNA binding protein
MGADAEQRASSERVPPTENRDLTVLYRQQKEAAVSPSCATDGRLPEIQPAAEQAGKPRTKRATLLETASFGPSGVPPALMSVADVCREARLGRTKVYELMKSGDLLRTKVGRRTFVKREDFENWVASLRGAC